MLRASISSYIINYNYFDDLRGIRTFPARLTSVLAAVRRLALRMVDTADGAAVRAWILLTAFVILFAGANQFFGLRYVSGGCGKESPRLVAWPA